MVCSSFFILQTSMCILLKVDETQGYIEGHMGAQRVYSSFFILQTSMCIPLKVDETQGYIEGHMGTQRVYSSFFILQTNMCIPFKVDETQGKTWEVPGSEHIEGLFFLHSSFFKPVSVCTENNQIQFNSGEGMAQGYLDSQLRGEVYIGVPRGTIIHFSGKIKGVQKY